MSAQPVRTQIRIPADLHRQLTAAATETGRSFNSEMVQRLEESFVASQLTDELIRSQLLNFQLASELIQYKPRTIHVLTRLIGMLFENETIRGRVFKMADEDDEIAVIARDNALQKLPETLEKVRQQIEKMQDSDEV